METALAVPLRAMRGGHDCSARAVDGSAGVVDRSACDGSTIEGVGASTGAGTVDAGFVFHGDGGWVGGW